MTEEQTPIEQRLVADLCSSCCDETPCGVCAEKIEAADTLATLRAKLAEAERVAWPAVASMAEAYEYAEKCRVAAVELREMLIADPVKSFNAVLKDGSIAAHALINVVNNVGREHGWHEFAMAVAEAALTQARADLEAERADKQVAQDYANKYVGLLDQARAEAESLTKLVHTAIDERDHYLQKTERAEAALREAKAFAVLSIPSEGTSRKIINIIDAYFTTTQKGSTES